MAGADRDRPGYETRDASMKLVAAIGIGLVLLTVAALVLMRGLFGVMEGAESRRQPEPRSLAAGAGPEIPPEPRLEPDPVASLAEVRAQEKLLLDSYGWVEGGNGAVRIPIDRAMELIVERGLPYAEEKR